MIIKHDWPRCECGHTYWDHDEDLVCELGFLDGCMGYWPDGLRVTRGDMWTRHGRSANDMQ